MQQKHSQQYHQNLQQVQHKHIHCTGMKQQASSTLEAPVTPASSV